MSAWLAAASTPKCGERCAERGALIEPRSIAASPVRPSGQRRSSAARWMAPATSSGSGADGCRLVDGSGQRRADVAHPAVLQQRLPEVLGDLAVPAAARLGEADEAVGAGQRLPLVASEERIDSRSRVGRRVGHLDLHRTAGVEAAAHEPDLLEHADEHARVGLVAELLRRHLRAAAQPRVDRAEVVDRRDVRAREAAQLLRVRPAREQERVRGAAVPAGAPDHLHVALERLGVVVERHEPDVRLVDAHPEGGRRDDRLDPAFDECLLSGRALGRLEPGVVVDGGQIVGSQRAREALAAAARARVDDRRRTAQLVQPANERPQARLLAVDDLDVVAQVGPDDARADDLRLAAESDGDLPLRRRRRGRSHAEDRGRTESVERAPDEEVVGPEVVPPHADAVHLVDHDETDVDVGDRVEEVAASEAARVRRRASGSGLPTTPRSRAAASSGSSEELISVDWAATSGGSLSTWSFISAISGRRDERRASAAASPRAGR